MAQRAWNRRFTSVSDDEKFMVVVLVVYNVKKNSVKSSLTVNWTRLFGSFERKNTGSSGTSEKCPVFPVLMFQTEVVFHFIKAIYDTSFRPSRPFIGKWIWFVQMVNPIPVSNLLVLNFAYHLPKLWTDRFAHVNGNNLCLLFNWKVWTRESFLK